MLKIETVFKIRSNDLDEAIQKHCKVKDYCFQQLNERPNDSHYSVDVTPWDMFSKENREDVRALQEENDEMELIRCYMGHLCFLGELPEGDYLISVCW